MNSAQAHLKKQQSQSLATFLESLSSRQKAILRASQVRDAADLYALLHNFPSLSRLDFDLPALSFAAFNEITPQHRISLASTDHADLPTSDFGAHPPADALAQLGYEVPEMPQDEAPPSQPLVAGSSQSTGDLIDLRPGDLRWPIRDQGQRGTCVAFALAACREHLDFGLGADPTRLDLSEQFLYWATKTQPGEPRPNLDGTLLVHASTALRQLGICREADWPYCGAPLPGNVTQQSPPAVPSQAAIAGAKAFAVSAGLYSTQGGAAALLSALQSQGRPIAISVPVFSDLSVSRANNWNTPLVYSYGKIIDPPPTSVVRNGHSVCIVGFAEDANEQMGGYFIFRNSWGPTLFGRSLPAPGYLGPEAGYGQISATYLDKYLWEMCQL